MLMQTIQPGNLHPLVVHLPIGILLLAFVLEVYFYRRKTPTSEQIILLVLAVGAIFSLFSVATGWLLGENGNYDETLLFLHRWLAIAFTCVAVVLCFLKRSTVPLANKLYLPVFFVTIILLGATGHYGGSMTHGEDFLFTDHSPKPMVITDVEKAQVYDEIIQPIFNAKCVSCHNSNKVKGGLQMSSKEHLLAGGDSGSLLDSTSKGQPSLLLQRLQLPVEHEEHMPPKGKVQLTPEELTLLNWWIDNDHCFDCVAGTLKKSEEIQEILNALEEDTSTKALIAKEVDEVPTSWLASFDNTAIVVDRLDEKSQLLRVSMGHQKHLTIREFKALDKFSENVVELNLGYSNFSDTLSVALPFFKNLTKLQLQHTAITDKTVKRLEEHNHLESVNLYATAITSKALDYLKELPKLTSVYLWQTRVNDDQIKQYAMNFPKVNVQGQIDDTIFAESSLSPPTMTSEADFFKDTLRVTLASSFKDAAIYYTSDGTDPDTTATKYVQPIILTESSEIKARVHLAGWAMSEIVSGNFKKTNLAYAGISINEKPKEKFKGQGAATLIDHKRGSSNFLDGHWLGFEGSNLTATIELKEKSLVSQVSVGTLSSPDKWIFYPLGFKVWTSDNGTNYTLVHTERLDPEQPNSTTKLRFFDLAIPPNRTSFVRIEVQSQLKNPSWHPNPGGASWLFLDEIIVN